MLMTDAIEAVVCDYGGVLTNPLSDTFASFEAATGVSAIQIGTAMAAAAAEDGQHPMAELETGRITEASFLQRLGRHMERPPEWLADGGFRRAWFSGRTANQPLVAYLLRLRARGLRIALLTNNVREWEPLWRATLPVDELFDLVVNSAEEGTRKPEPEIYRRTVERLGLPARGCLFVDDLEENCATARAVGMRAVRFTSNEQAIADIEHALRGAG